VDFSVYGTFAWAPDSGKNEPTEVDASGFDNDIVRNNAQNYISHILIRRGYVLDVDSPDLVVRLVLLDEKQDRIITYYSHRYMWYYYYSPYYFPYYYPYPRFYTWYGWDVPAVRDFEVTRYTKTYSKGTITINIYDRKLKRLIWTGCAEGDIYDPSYIHFDVHPAIDLIIREFPARKVLEENRQDTVRQKIVQVPW